VNSSTGHSTEHSLTFHNSSFGNARLHAMYGLGLSSRMHLQTRGSAIAEEPRAFGHKSLNLMARSPMFVDG